MTRFSQQTSRSARRPAREARPARRVKALDGLRVFAMLAIVVYHANVNWLPGGFLGVTVFFTLSGYLITDTLLRELKRTEGSIDVVGFYARRLRRLWPLMLLVVGCTAIICALFAPGLLAKMRGDTIPALLFYENWWFIVREQSYFAASGLPSPITHFWFISVIVQFYFVWPWVVLLLSRTLRSRSACSNAIAAVALLSAVLAAVLFNPTGDPSRVYYGTDTRFAETAIGAWLAYVWPSDGMTGRARDIVERMGIFAHPVASDLFAVGALVGLGFLCRTMNGYSPLLYRGGLFGVSLLTAIVIGAVVRPGSLLAKTLGVWPLVEVAKRTFGIYLWHYPLLLVMNPATRTTALPWWGWVLEALVIVSAVELSWHLVEEPVNALLKYLATPQDLRADAPRGLVPTWVSVAVLLGITVVGGALIYVGPFWYEDGALQQATQTETPAPQPAPAPPAETAPSANIDEAVERAVAYLQEVLRDTTWTVDPDTGACDAPVILIGDSVPAGAIDQFYEIFPEGYIDAEVGRQLYDAVDIYSWYRDNGYGNQIVVFSCGDNGVVQEDDVVALVEAPGARKVYLVTARVPLPLQDMNNAVFYDVASRYDNVEVIDWYAESEGHDDYFWDDGTHLRPEGAEAYVLMIRRAICGE